MNIGIVTTWFERGAAYVSRAYMETLSVEHKVFIYARGGERYAKGDPRWDAPNVTWGKQVSDKLVTHVDFDDFAQWQKANRIDLVIFNEQHSWKIILQIRERLSIPIVAYIDYYTSDTVPFFRLYDLLLCHTKRHLSVFKDHPRAVYMPWGTNLNLFKPTTRSDPTDHVVLFHSCGLSPLRKGIDILVRAFQHVTGDARLVIHSQGPFTEHPPTAALIASDERIELVEQEVGAPGLYHRGDVYVYPTRLEGIGLTIAEALASGLPVITPDMAPMNEFVEHEANGRLVAIKRTQPRADNYYWPESFCREDSLTAAMQFYVDDATRLFEYRRRAREYAEAHLDWKKNSQSLGEILEHTSLTALSVEQGLLSTVSRYERSRYGHPLLPEAVSTVLRKAGAGKVRRLMRGRR